MFTKTKSKLWDFAFYVGLLCVGFIGGIIAASCQPNPKPTVKVTHTSKYVTHTDTVYLTHQLRTFVWKTPQVDSIKQLTTSWTPRAFLSDIKYEGHKLSYVVYDTLKRAFLLYHINDVGEFGLFAGDTISVYASPYKRPTPSPIRFHLSSFIDYNFTNKTASFGVEPTLKLWSVLISSPVTVSHDTLQFHLKVSYQFF